MPASAEEPWTPAEYVINGVKVGHNVNANSLRVSSCEDGVLVSYSGFSDGGCSIFEKVMKILYSLFLLHAKTHSHNLTKLHVAKLLFLLVFFQSKSQLVFAISPLLVLAYILISAFESEEQEEKKRKKKTDFNLEGHAE
jgi:hypothetical protein